jgi:hypothetical protein
MGLKENINKYSIIAPIAILALIIIEMLFIDFLALPEIELFGGKITHSWGLIILSAVVIILAIVKKFLQLPPASIIVNIVFWIALVGDLIYFAYVLVNYVSMDFANFEDMSSPNVENPGIVIPDEATEGSNWLTGIWESLSSSFDSLFGNLGSLGQQ